MPRLGLATIDISTLGGSEGVVTTIDDFVFESFSAGQMHPIRTASRTNLVLHSENFDTSGGWGQDDATIDPNSTTAPDGTLTADKIIGSTVSSRHNIVDTGLTNTVTASISVHAKAGELRYLQVASANTTSQYANFDLLTGTIGTIGSDFANVAMDSLANGWYRITLTSVGKYNSFYLSLVSGLTASWLESWSMSNNTDGLFLWGAQLEEDGFASAYIPTSGSTVTVSTTLNDTSNVWDFDGTDIMIAEDPEDEGFWEESYPDGATLPELVLNGDYEDLGSELVGSGTFSSFSVESGDVTISGNTASFVDGGTNTNSRVALVDVLTANKTYKVVFSVTRYVAGRVQMIFGGGNTLDVDISAGVGTYTAYIVTGGSTSISIKRNGGYPNFDFDLTNISVKQVDPNDRWTLGTGWSIEDGKAVHEGGSSNTYLEQQNITTIGSVYEAVFTLSGSLNATNYIQVYGASSYTISPNKYTSAGTYTLYFTADATYFRFRAVSPDNDISIDNVTVKEYAIQPLDI